MERHRWELRARAIEAGQVRVFCRKNQFVAGPPLEFDAESPTLSALEYALGALAAEIAGGFAQRARARRLQLDDVEATVTGEVNDPLVPLGVIGAKGHPGIEYLAVKLFVSSPEDEATLRVLWSEVLETSPLLWTLRKATRVEVELQVAI